MTTRDKGITLPNYSFFKTDNTGLAVTTVASDYSSNTAWKYSAGNITPVNFTCLGFVSPQNYTINGQNANTAFGSVGGQILLRPGLGSLGNSSGNLIIQDQGGLGGAWNSSHLVLGTIHFWCSGASLGTLRYKNGVPLSDTDGIPVDTSYTGTAVYDPPSLIDGAGVTTTVGVASAALGDRLVGHSFSIDTQGIILYCWVSGLNTVSVRFQNETGGTIDLASGTLKVWVAKGN